MTRLENEIVLQYEMLQSVRREMDKGDREGEIEGGGYREGEIGKGEIRGQMRKIKRKDNSIQ